MESANQIKNWILAAASVLGSAIAGLVGGFDAGMQTLLVFMVVDYCLGLAVAMLQRSGKTEGGGLDSKVGFRGICKKLAMIAAVIAVTFLDRVIGDTSFTRTAVIFFFLGNEGLSVIENLAIIGVPFPASVKKVLEQLKQSADAEHKNE